MGTTAENVNYGNEPNEYSGDRTHESKYDFENTLVSIRRGIEDSGLWIIAEINPQLLAAKAGYGIAPARQILFFHPRYLKKLLEANPDALIEIPLKVTIMEKPGGKVALRFSDTESIFKMYPELSELGCELSELVNTLKREVEI